MKDTRNNQQKADVEVDMPRVDMFISRYHGIVQYTSGMFIKSDTLKFNVSYPFMVLPIMVLHNLLS